MVENKGFEVLDEVEIGTLDDVKEQRTVLPPTKGVKLLITKAEPRGSKDGAYRSINLACKLVDGIGEEGKYKNMVVFSSVCYYADPDQYNKDFFKNKQHLVQLKYLKGAVILTDPTKVNDQFVSELANQYVVGDIVQTKPRTYTAADGTEVTTDIGNEVRNFKKIADEDLV